MVYSPLRSRGHLTQSFVPGDIILNQRRSDDESTPKAGLIES